MTFRLYLYYACTKATMASFNASHPKRHDFTLARTGGERRSLDVCAHLKDPWRRVVKKINVLSGPSKKIVGLKKKKKKKMMMMMPGLQDSRVWEFSHEALKVRRGPLGICIGTYGPLEFSSEFLNPS